MARVRDEKRVLVINITPCTKDGNLFLYRPPTGYAGAIPSSQKETHFLMGFEFSAFEDGYSVSPSDIKLIGAGENVFSPTAISIGDANCNIDVEHRLKQRKWLSEEKIGTYAINGTPNMGIRFSVMFDTPPLSMEKEFSIAIGIDQGGQRIESPIITFSKESNEWVLIR